MQTHAHAYSLAHYAAGTSYPSQLELRIESPSGQSVVKLGLSSAVEQLAWYHLIQVRLLDGRMGISGVLQTCVGVVKVSVVYQLVRVCCANERVYLCFALLTWLQRLSSRTTPVTPPYTVRSEASGGTAAATPDRGRKKEKKEKKEKKGKKEVRGLDVACAV